MGRGNEVFTLPVLRGLELEVLRSCGFPVAYLPYLPIELRTVLVLRVREFAGQVVLCRGLFRALFPGRSHRRYRQLVREALRPLGSLQEECEIFVLLTWPRRWQKRAIKRRDRNG